MDGSPGKDLEITEFGDRIQSPKEEVKHCQILK